MGLTPPTLLEMGIFTGYQPRRRISARHSYVRLSPWHSVEGARIVLMYVATLSPEFFAESRFCLSRRIPLFGAGHEPARAQSSWT